MKNLHHVAITFIGIIICLTCFQYALSGKTSIIDSLENLLEAPLPDTQRINILVQLGQQLKYRDPQKGLGYCQEVYQWAKQHTDSSRLIAAHDGLGDCYYYAGQLQEAELHWKKVHQLRQHFQDSLGLGSIYNNFGMLYETRGDLDSATYAYQEALLMYEQHGTPYHSALIYNNLGLVFTKRGYYPQASTYFLQALSHFEKSGKKRAISVALNNVGMIHTKQHSYQEAITYYRRSLEVKEALNDTHGMATSYNNIGAVFEEMNEPDSAIYYHEASLRLKQQMGDEMGIGISFNNLGIAYERLGYFERAKDFQLKSYRIAKKINSPSDLARAGVDLGRIYLKLNQLTKAEKYLQESLVNSQLVGERENQLKVYKCLYQLYKKQNNANALVYYEQFVSLNDSLRNDEQLKEITRLEMQYEFDKEKDILAVKNEQSEKLLKAQIQRQRIIRNASFSGLLAGVLIIIILWRSYQQKQKSNRLLNAQKKTIEQTLEERETLLKEIHHRVKNNLQVISSLLSLQSRSIQDPIALGAIEEGRNRVKAMALIHQNLYQDENLVGVHLPDYIQKLTTNLINSYRTDQKQIKITQDIAPISLDADTLIPLALILNELISNALKYAFQEQEQGEIGVAITPQEGGLKIVVSDNGSGLPPGFKAELSSSLGFKLIRSFVNKMKAHLDIFSEQGTKISILVPDFQ